MRRRFGAAAFALGVLLTTAVSPAAAYSNSGWIMAVHCITKWTISSAYLGHNVATLTWTKGDPDANCHALEIDMKWLPYAGASTMYESSVTVPTPSPKTTNYTASLVKDGVYCVAVRYWSLVAPGANVTTGWITC